MQLLPKDTYLQMIKNGVGSKLFRNLYADIDGVKTDILRDGDLSCNFFASLVLWHFRLLKEGPHANTPGFIRDLEGSGWTKTPTPHAGDIVLWSPKVGKSGELHPHTGFYIDENTAISNSDIERAPILHHLTFDNTRAIEAIYTHAFLQ